jgi:uncharacterized membrane protein YhaH (DUF805 family)
MGEFSIWHWVIFFVLLFFSILPLWKILNKAGFSGWWSLLSLIPVINAVALYVFAFSKWPNRQI